VRNRISNAKGINEIEGYSGKDYLPNIIITNAEAFGPITFLTGGSELPRRPLVAEQQGFTVRGTRDARSVGAGWTSLATYYRNPPMGSGLLRWSVPVLLLLVSSKDADKSRVLSALP